MQNFLTGEELEQKYYNDELDLKSLPLEDLIVLSDYLGETELSNKQLNLLDKCLEQISTFEGYEVDEQSKEQTWNKILLKFEELEKEDNSSIIKCKIKFRKKLAISLVAVFVSILGISTVVCNANGINLFSLFFNGNTGIVSTNQNSEIDIDNYYDDVDTFLSDHSDIIFPDYLPSGYTFDNAIYHLDGLKEEYTILFGNDTNIIRFKQTTYLGEQSLPNIQYEVDGTIIEEYTYNEIVYYIYSNKQQLTAIWNNGNTQYLLNTSCSIDELKEIINSMY